MSRYLLLLMICMLSVASLQAQKGRVQGLVRDQKMNETLIGAAVLVKGTTTGATTDLEGLYELELNPGTYVLQVSYISYDPQEITVEIKAGQVLVRDFDLVETSFALSGVTITATRRSNSDVAVIHSIKSANLVASGISAQQISRAQERDASDVVKRVSGITVVDDRFVVVRGLNSRYNSTWLNQVAVPGADPDNKAFSFDAIPASMIDHMFVVKSPSADLPSDYAGGFVKIQTKGLPDQDVFQISYSTGLNTQSISNDYYVNKVSPLDYLALGKQSRQLPEAFPDQLSRNETENKAYGKMMDRSWQPQHRSQWPSQNVSVLLGHRLDQSGYKLGQLTALSYGHSFSVKDLVNRAFGAYQPSENQSILKYDYQDHSSAMTAKIGALHNWTFQTEDHKIEFRNLLNVMGTNRAIMREGEANFSGEKHIRSYGYGYTQRTLYSGQLLGEHRFKEDGTQRLEWAVGYAFSGRSEPDTRQIETVRISGEQTEDPADDRYQVSMSTEPNPQYLGNVFSTLKEHLAVLNINYTHGFQWGSFKPELKVGLYGEQKSRRFDMRVFGYYMGRFYENELALVGSSLDDLFSDAMIDREQIAFGERRNDENAYTAHHTNWAAYALFNLPIGPAFKAVLGIRGEYNHLVLATRVEGQDLRPSLQTFLPMPSVNLSYTFDTKHVLRLAYGRATNRPEFREMAPYSFYDFEQGRDVRGNVDLQSCIVDNIDLRYELYPSQSETFTIGGFFKYFDRPIETSYSQTANQYSFQNARAAINYGVEAELRKTLSEIQALRHWSLVLNASWIQSEVRFDPSVEERNRPMQGQSPYVVNAGIFYHQPDWGLSVSLLYHTSGKRIAAIGTDDRNASMIQRQPDVYEAPVHQLDLSVSKSFAKGWEVKLAMKNILNRASEFYQSVQDENGIEHIRNINKYYREGVDIRLSISYNINHK